MVVHLRLGEVRLKETEVGIRAASGVCRLAHDSDLYLSQARFRRIICSQFRGDIGRKGRWLRRRWGGVRLDYADMGIFSLRRANGTK